MKIKRRTFIKTTLVGFSGLTLGCGSSSKEETDAGADAGGMDGGPNTDPSGQLGIWLNVSEDGKVTVLVVKAEMGQAVSTSIPMVIAEELDAAWEDVGFELVAELPDNAYTPAPFGIPMTSGSTSIHDNFEMLREIGAAAREMLVAAAAARWDVGPDSLVTSDGVVTHASHGSLSYGEVAHEASLLTVPEEPTLKDSSKFKIIGKSMARLDTPDMVEGKTIFAQDVVVSDMLYATIRHSPVIGGELSNLAELEEQVETAGALGVAKVPNGVAIMASGFWEAENAANKLSIEFDTTDEMNNLSSESISEGLSSSLDQPGDLVLLKGDVVAAEGSVVTTHLARYEVPLLAHATMEPMVCTAHVSDGGCELWIPTQTPLYAVRKVAAALDIPESSVTVNATFIGGGFGRRGEADYAIQAALASQAVGRPVKIMWNRAEDIRNDYFRPAFAAELEAGLDADGNLVTWVAKNTGPSVLRDNYPGKIDPLSIDAFNKLFYEIPNQRISHVVYEYGVRVGFWRSVGHSQNCFFVECFMDELANEAGVDPMEFRKTLVKDNPRYLAVLEEAERISNWGSPETVGAHHGVAIVEGAGSVTAQVAEVSVDVTSSKVTVHKVYAVIDCGDVVNPDTIEAQIQGGVVFGLTAALHGEITISDGRVEQSNFHDYPTLNLKDSPPVEVSILISGEPRGGVGELGVSPVAPAVANAVFKATNERIRKLPLRNHVFTAK